MNQTLKKVLFWSPRVLGILIAAFVGLFALDVFAEGYSILEMLIALGMHLIPTAIILIALVVACRWEWIGGILFIALGIFYITLFYAPSELPAYLLISGPLFIAGVLFMVNGFFRGEIRADS
ncbi:MAG: hypothetical protein JSV42_02175 [Chloroflexota bacterium]|nr:MAG: hypothetical protein JSV42_02175 [Chloroflexota bacterium]